MKNWYVAYYPVGSTSIRRWDRNGGSPSPAFSTFRSISKMRIGLNGAQDFMALLVRRKWWVLAPFLALSCAVAVLTYVLPRTFISEVLILVRPRDVPQDFVRNSLPAAPKNG